MRRREPVKNYQIQLAKLFQLVGLASSLCEAAERWREKEGGGGKSGESARSRNMVHGPRVETEKGVGWKR